jgi:MFS family permease
MMRGRVLALQSMVFLGSTPLGGPLLGWVSDAWGARVAIAVGAVAAIGAGAFGLYARRRWPAAEASDAEDIDLRERVDPTRVAEAAG